MIDFGIILFVGAHPDDLVSSCSGIIQRALKPICLCLTHYKTNRCDEYVKGMKMLSVEEWFIVNGNDTALDLNETISLVETYARDHEIKTIFMHDPFCVHQDHRTTSRACQIVARKGNINLIYYEDYRKYISDHAWKPNLFVRLTKEELDKKRKALYCHKSQKGEWMEDILRNTVERFQIAYLVL